MPFRIAIITDIHHGIGPEGQRGGSALAALGAFVDWVNAVQPDLVLDLGDRIMDQDPVTDKRLARDVADALGACQSPVMHINGNHDLNYLTAADNAAILGQHLEHKVLEAGGWNLVLWRADCRLPRGKRLVLEAQDVAWLRKTLEGETRPTLIASHVPLFQQDMTSNHYFQENPEIATYRGIEAVRDVLNGAACPLVTISGHVHWTTAQQRGGIWHLTQQAATEIYPTGRPAMAWSLMELDDRLKWQVEGAEPMALECRPSAHRWAEPLPRFPDMPAAC